MSQAQWDSANEDDRFKALRTVGFSKHDAGILKFHKWEKLPAFVQKMIQVIS